MLSRKQKCSGEITELAELYLLGRLPEAENQALEEHLLSCSKCMNALEETETFMKAIRGANHRLQAASTVAVPSAAASRTRLVLV